MTLAATIDAGGSGVKVGVVCTDTWRLLADVHRDYAPVSREPGLLEWDPASWWRAIVSALADAVAAAGRAGVALPRADVYRHAHPVRPRRRAARSGRAGRARARSPRCRARRVATLVDRERRAVHDDRALELALLRTAEARLVRARAARALEAHPLGAAAARLAARAPLRRDRERALVGLDGAAARRVARRWSTEVLDAAGIDPERMPPLIDAGAVAGGLASDVAASVGLTAGTPVHVGGGDTHVSALGAGAVEDGVTVVVAGSTTPMHLATAEPRLDLVVRPLVSAHLRPGVFAAETNVSTSGSMLRWLRDTTALDYPALEAAADESPLGARGVVVAASNPEWGEGPWSQVPAHLDRRSDPDAHDRRPRARDVRVDDLRDRLRPRTHRFARTHPGPAADPRGRRLARHARSADARRRQRTERARSGPRERDRHGRRGARRRAALRAATRRPSRAASSPTRRGTPPTSRTSAATPTRSRAFARRSPNRETVPA